MKKLKNFTIKKIEPFSKLMNFANGSEFLDIKIDINKNSNFQQII